jgi:D-3-phosphoglycerate dehydrogenase
MRAWFIDCTSELAELFDSGAASVPQGVNIHYGDPDTLAILEMARDADVLIVEQTVIPDAVFAQVPGLQAIVFMGTGAGTYVDAALAARHGVPVLTTPGYGSVAVAEHAFALMMAGARQVARMDREIRAGLWQPRGGLQLAGRKVAVLGMGGIGRAFAERCAGFGMRVAGWNRSPLAHPLFCADLDEALRRADVVSLHLTLNEATRGSLDAERLALPAPGFLLVNTARSQLIDRYALIRALDSGQRGHLATDVFDAEPLAPNDPLRGRENVTLTAHAA